MAELFVETWTTEQVERLKALHAEGLSASAIGDRLGMTRNAVIGKCSRLGLNRNGVPPIVWTDERNALLHRMFVDNKCNRDIAQEIGCSQDAVKRRAKKLGLKREITAPVRKVRRRRYSVKPVVVGNPSAFKVVAANANSNVKRLIPAMAADVQPLRCVEVHTVGLPLLNLAPHHCRYAVTDGGPHLFCALNISAGRYCEQHHDLTRSQNNGWLGRDRPAYSSLRRRLFLTKSEALSSLDVGASIDFGVSA